METNIQTFKSPQFGEIRTTGTSEQPLFCLADLCRSAGIANARNVRKRLDDWDVHQMDTPTSSGIQSMTYVTESGMYNVILRSDSPQAKHFRKWVTSEVLPSIRKNGGYISTASDDTPDVIMARALMLAQDTIRRHKKQLEQANCTIKVQAPKVLFANAVEASDKSCLIGELAKILRQNGVEFGQNRLFAWMRLNGYLCSSGERYNQPTQRAMEMGLFEIKKTTVTKPSGDTLVTATTKVTGKGQIYFVNKFMAFESELTSAKEGKEEQYEQR